MLSSPTGRCRVCLGIVDPAHAFEQRLAIMYGSGGIHSSALALVNVHWSNMPYARCAIVRA
eukprot:2220233-Pyramimonas_sp.AAC.1